MVLSVEHVPAVQFTEVFPVEMINRLQHLMDLVLAIPVHSDLIHPVLFQEWNLRDFHLWITLADYHLGQTDGVMDLLVLVIAADVPGDDLALVPGEDPEVDAEVEDDLMAEVEEVEVEEVEEVEVEEVVEVEEEVAAVAGVEEVEAVEAEIIITADYG